MESIESRSRFLITYHNFGWKSTKIPIFSHIYCYLSPVRGYLWNWLNIYVSSILWPPCRMVIGFHKSFYSRLPIENVGKIHQISPKSRNNGSKTKELLFFFLCKHQISLLHYLDAQLNGTFSWKNLDDWIKTPNFRAICIRKPIKKPPVYMNWLA